MIVLLHAYNLGFTAWETAIMFTLYETAGVFTNLAAGMLGEWLRRAVAHQDGLSVGQCLMSADCETYNPTCWAY